MNTLLNLQVTVSSPQNNNNDRKRVDNDCYTEMMHSSKFLVS